MLRCAGAFLAAGLLRLALVSYGQWQDAHLEVGYTDIDYTVFSDASALMSGGQSPYLRSTYRYSPILAFLLLPNSWIHPSWGKLLFSTADLLAGLFLYRLLVLQGLPTTKSTLYTALLWLFNPFTFTIATRGNCEALPCAIILWVLLRLLQGHDLQAAAWFGLVVHLRVYPIIYALPFVLYLSRGSSVVGRRTLAFASVSGGVFLVLTTLCYWLYGMDYLNEALLYHITRTDPRHNFSAYFYSIYLHQDRAFSLLERLASFLPQLVLQATIAVRFSRRDLPFTLFAQTLAFVTFNKVITAQYFVWFICLLPLVIRSTSMKPRTAVLCAALWTAAQTHWLGWAYLLEFKGRNVFLQLWLASLVFFGTNCFTLAMFFLHHRWKDELKSA